MNIAKECLVESLEIQLEVVNAKLDILKTNAINFACILETKCMEEDLLRVEKKVLEKNLKRLKLNKSRGTVKS